MPQLSKKQIERQDYVDNQVYVLIQNLLPTGKHIDWNIEMIGSVRDAIFEQLADRKVVVNEMSFYPYLKQ